MRTLLTLLWLAYQLASAAVDVAVSVVTHRVFGRRG
ncbi:MAG: hypothetical protein JWO31_2744 [Phycisphaerales bacterium]|nr:hypothetical protein [Phycisphaerales bacterium]